MDKQKYIDKMVEIKNRDGYDVEEEHIQADDLLCELLIELGFEEVVDEYNEIRKFYS